MNARDYEVLVKRASDILTDVDAVNARMTKAQYDELLSICNKIGIEMPENPFGVCNEIKEKLGISCMLVDANDLGQEILGFSDDLKNKESILKEFIKDNPAGQEKELTPIILIFISVNSST